VHDRLSRTIGESRNERHSLRSIGKAGATAGAGHPPTVRGIAMNPSTTRAVATHHTAAGIPVSAVGHADQGLQDAQEQAHGRDDRAPAQAKRDNRDGTLDQEGPVRATSPESKVSKRARSTTRSRSRPGRRRSTITPDFVG
jgi:hypothetical protein